MTITRGHNLSYVAADGVVNDVTFSEVPAQSCSRTAAAS